MTADEMSTWNFFREIYHPKCPGDLRFRSALMTNIGTIENKLYGIDNIDCKVSGNRVREDLIRKTILCTMCHIRPVWHITPSIVQKSRHHTRPNPHYTVCKAYRPKYRFGEKYISGQILPYTKRGGSSLILHV